jgi:hypothetical protein
LSQSRILEGQFRASGVFIVSVKVVSIDALPKPMRGWHGNSIKDTAI